MTAPRPRPHTSRRRNHVVCVGFTLIELLVAIVILAILISLVIAGVRGSRAAAINTKCQVHQRTCLLALLGYTNEHRGYFPILGELRLENAFDTVYYGRLDYYTQRSMWHIAVRDALGPTGIEPVQACAADPQYQRDTIGETRAQAPPDSTLPTAFWLTHAAISDPAAWLPGGNPEDERVLRGVRIDEVAFPSAKTLLSETNPRHLGITTIPGGAHRSTYSLLDNPPAAAKYNLAMADASIRSVHTDNIVPGFVGPTGRRYVPTIGTPGGICGRDVLD